MRHLRPISSLLIPLCVAALMAAGAPSLHAQSRQAHTDALIKDALSAAPASVAAGATVVDLEQKVIRQGTNGYVCMPDRPEIPNNVPMCLDETWMEVIDAWMSKRQPDYSGIGISYMLQGDMPVSNADPFATGPTDENQWIQSGPPHIMVAVSDLSLLEGLTTDPNNGGPWVMWKGTPYAHIMIPTVPREE